MGRCAAATQLRSMGVDEYLVVQLAEEQRVSPRQGREEGVLGKPEAAAELAEPVD